VRTPGFTSDPESDVNPRSISFSELYVSSFLNGGSYEAIQLEVNATGCRDVALFLTEKLPFRWRDVHMAVLASSLRGWFKCSAVAGVWITEGRSDRLGGGV
jgi:hypothetical protein